MNIQTKHDAHEKLNDIVVGMEVYDSGGAYAGTVKAIRLGEGIAKTRESDLLTMDEEISRTLGYRTDLPIEIYPRLYEGGFISLDSGFLRPDVIVVPEQISEIGKDTVFLRVRTDALLAF